MPTNSQLVGQRSLWLPRDIGLEGRGERDSQQRQGRAGGEDEKVETSESQAKGKL